MKPRLIDSSVDLNGLEISELNNVIFNCNAIIRNIKMKANIERKEVSKAKLKVGDIVSVTGKRFDGEIWEVLKLNPKKVKCLRENGETWNIPYAHIIIE